MKYLTTCALLLCTAGVNAETSSALGVTSNKNNAVSIQQATQSIARKLISQLNLTSVSESEVDSITLKEVVLKALQAGKPMSEIRLATNKAVSEVTGKTVTLESASNATPEADNSSDQSVEQAVETSEVVANPAEVTLDPESGKMIATVLPSESIFRLAQRVYGKENGRMYLKIFAANTDKIKDINVVVEGQQLVIP